MIFIFHRYQCHKNLFYFCIVERIKYFWSRPEPDLSPNPTFSSPTLARTRKNPARRITTLNFEERAGFVILGCVSFFLLPMMCSFCTYL